MTAKPIHPDAVLETVPRKDAGPKGHHSDVAPRKNRDEKKAAVANRLEEDEPLQDEAPANMEQIDDDFAWALANLTNH